MSAPSICSMRSEGTCVPSKRNSMEVFSGETWPEMVESNRSSDLPIVFGPAMGISVVSVRAV